jgi:transposase
VIGSTRVLRVLGYGQPADMRKGFDGLYGLVRTALGQDPLSGDLYLFVSRDRRRAKVLLWDGTGLCMYSKRLERGRFANLWTEGVSDVSLTMSELQLFLEGSRAVGHITLSPPMYCRRVSA